MVLTLFTDTTMIAGANAAATLSVPLYGQEQSLWCWAASVQMVEQQLRGTHHTQCQIVKYGLGKTTECPNQGASEAQAQTAIESAQMSSSGYYSNGLLPVKSLDLQISGGHPFLYHYAYTSGGGHMVVVTGSAPDPGGGALNGVYWSDPLPVGAGLNPDPPIHACYTSPSGHADEPVDAQRASSPPSHHPSRHRTHLVPLATAAIGGSGLKNVGDWGYLNSNANWKAYSTIYMITKV